MENIDCIYSMHTYFIYLNIILRQYKLSSLLTLCATEQPVDYLPFLFFSVKGRMDHV